MIRVFGATDKVFSSNGDCVLKPLKAKIHKADNGDYYLDLTTGIEYSDYLVNGNIIVANTPQGYEPFRISNPRCTGRKIELKAWHVFFDAKNYLIQDSFPQNKTCAQALEWLNSATEPQSEFTTSSNITKVDSIRIVRKSLYEAVFDVLERWGGHLVRTGFHIGINSSIGQDNGVTVEYAKNLKEITVEYNWDNVVTKILPTGTDGIMLNSLNPSASPYITSSTQYAIPYTKTVAFTQSISQEDYPSETAYKQALINDLRTQATAYLTANCVPQVNYTLKANLDRITDVGDTVQVKDKRIGVDLLTSVISYEYDCILEKYTEVEFGNFRRTLSGLIPSINSSVSSAVTQATAGVEADLARETSDIWGTLGNSYVINEGNQILVVDTLPKETAVNVMRIDKDGISFSSDGIYGTFQTLWSIAGVLKLMETSSSMSSDLSVLGWSGDLVNSLLDIKSLLEHLVNRFSLIGKELPMTSGGEAVSSWSSGTVPVEGSSKYMAFLIIQGGGTLIAYRDSPTGSVIRGDAISGNATSGNYNQYVRAFGATTAGEGGTHYWSKQLSHVTSSGYHTSGTEQAITKIYGLIPVPTA